MSALKNKTILIVSPQLWGTMFVSKHHYAMELAKYGNEVYFLNPPDQSKTGKMVNISPSGVHDNLFIIQHRLSFPYAIKFHMKWLFHMLMRPHVRSILKKIGKPVDIVWSFDLGNLYPFDCFNKQTYKVFHPVDEPLNETAIESARDADIIFSVTHEILEKYKAFDTPKHFINHGVSEEFIKPLAGGSNNGKVHAGFSGNLLRNDIDRDILLQIIQENAEVVFECWGSYNSRQANIGGVEDTGVQSFIARLKKMPNVVLHGAVSTQQLAKDFQRMDLFLICYDVQRDQSKGTNYHKVMEYLSTGKVIVSNNITTYRQQPQLVQMITERQHNQPLPGLFKQVIGHLTEHNAPGLVQYRKDFVQQNTYRRQIERIESLIYPNTPVQ